MKDQSESKRDSRSRERGVLTEVAQKVGTAVGTVVSALSRTTGQGSKKTTTGGSSHSPGAKASRQRAGNQPAKAETEHSPLKRRRRRSKSTK
jgi:hypothetical protein